MKEKFISFLEVIKGLIKFPIVFGLVVVAFALNIIQEFFPTKGWIQFLQLIGIIIIAAIITNVCGTFIPFPSTFELFCFFVFSISILSLLF